MATVKHYHNHYRFSYNTSLKRHFSSVLIVIFVLFLIFLTIFHFLSPTNTVNLNEISVLTVIYATADTLFRLTVAYLIALLLAIPLSLMITSTPRVERILLPISDVIQSVPILAFFPIVVLVFVKFQFFDGAAIFILFMAMLWNIVFTIIGGLKTIPQDVISATVIFKAKGLRKFFYVTLPSVFPAIITGSFLAWGQGWNISIVAEALHNYIPGSNSSCGPVRFRKPSGQFIISG